MNLFQHYRSIDLSVVFIANIINLLLVVMFWARIAGRTSIARYAGLGTILLGFPLLILAITNLTQRREWWTYVLPLLMAIFLLVELLLDYVLKIG
jgi:hypothetical protein